MILSLTDLAIYAPEALEGKSLEDLPNDKREWLLVRLREAELLAQGTNGTARPLEKQMRKSRFTISSVNYLEHYPVHLPPVWSWEPPTQSYVPGSTPPPTDFSLMPEPAEIDTPPFTLEVRYRSGQRLGYGRFLSGVSVGDWAVLPRRSYRVDEETGEVDFLNDALTLEGAQARVTYLAGYDFQPDPAFTDEINPYSEAVRNIKTCIATLFSSQQATRHLERLLTSQGVKSGRQISSIELPADELKIQYEGAGTMINALKGFDLLKENHQSALMALQRYRSRAVYAI